MKTYYFIAVLFISLSISAHSQEKSKSAFVKSKSEILKSKENGSYTFTFPKGTKKEEIEQSAKYYTIYFNVIFDELTSEAKINLITNDFKVRHVICRFLASNNIQIINMEGEEFVVEEFYKQYMK
jgi:hypothetical protein